MPATVVGSSPTLTTTSLISSSTSSTSSAGAESPTPSLLSASSSVTSTAQTQPSSSRIPTGATTLPTGKATTTAILPETSTSSPAASLTQTTSPTSPSTRATTASPRPSFKATAGKLPGSSRSKAADGYNIGASGQMTVYVAAGAGVGALLLIVTGVVVAVVWWKKRKTRKIEFTTKSSGNISGVVVNPTYVSTGVDEQESYRHLNGIAAASFNNQEYDIYDQPAEIKAPSKKVDLNFYSTPEEPLYWQPATTESELYAQIEGRKFSKIDRNAIVIGKELGSGEFGMVAKGVWNPVTHENEKIEVAVKTLISTSHEDRVKFLREAAIMGQFHHKNVAALYGVVTAGEPIMLVLELVENGDLKDRLIDVKTSLKKEPTLNLACQLLVSSAEIATGMDYLSGKSFIHRDLAARNVLLDHNFTCKIGDFGMARDLADDTYYVTSGGKIPIRWTPPEALYFRKYSTASDVWSFGIVLYEIWSLGERPFGSMTNTEVQEMIDAGYRLPPPPGCPRAIYQLMMQCWNSDYHKRPSFSDTAAFLCRDENKLLLNQPEDEATMGQIGGNLEDRDLQALYLK